jgi:MFS family permease
LFLGVGLGASLSTLVNMMLSHYLTEAEILAFGWRIPFLLAGLLAAVGYYLRRYTQETPAFQQQTQFHKMPLLHLLNQAPQRWFQGVGIMIFAACLVTFGLYLPVYLTQYCHYDSSHIYSAMSLSFLLSAFCLPVFGMLSDKIGRQRMLLMAISITLLLLILSLPSLGKHQFNVMAFMLLYYIAITSMAACYPVMLAELFNTTSRYSGVASCYTTAYACSAFIPALFTALLLHMSAVHLIWVFIILASISLIATSYYQGHQAKAFY